MQQHLDKACAVVRAGGLIAYPTEGVFGIGCDPYNEAALQRLLAVKQRDPSKGFILIAATMDMLSPFIATLDKDTRTRVLATWPGPITWVLPKAENTSDIITGGRATVAARVTAHPFAQALSTTLGHTLISTSANLSGQPAITCLQELQQTLGNDVDYVVPLEAGGLQKPTPIFDAVSGEQLR